MRHSVSSMRSISTSIHKNIDSFHKNVVAKREVFASVDRSASYSTLVIMAMVLMLTTYQVYSLRSELMRRKLV